MLADLTLAQCTSKKCTPLCPFQESGRGLVKALGSQQENQRGPISVTTCHSRPCTCCFGGGHSLFKFPAVGPAPGVHVAAGALLT